MTKIQANLETLLTFYKKHEDLQRELASLKTQLKLSEAIIKLHRANAARRKDLEIANLIIDLSN
jgi:hypothetical protein